MSQPLIQIQVICTDPNLAAGVYANGTQQRFNDNGNEFIVDFLQVIQDSNPLQAILRARVTLSPLQAKKTAEGLASMVRLYEERFGPVLDPTRPKDEETVQ